MSILSNTTRKSARSKLERPEGLPDESSGNLFTYGLMQETVSGRFSLQAFCAYIPAIRVTGAHISIWLPSRSTMRLLMSRFANIFRCFTTSAPTSPYLTMWNVPILHRSGSSFPAQMRHIVLRTAPYKKHPPSKLLGPQPGQREFATFSDEPGF